MRYTFLAIVFAFLGNLPVRVYGADVEDELVEAISQSPGSLDFSSHTIDAGKIQQGQDLSFVFPYHVSSIGPVTVLGIHQECGCMSQSLLPGQVLAAGERGILNVKIDTGKFTGNFDKFFVLLTNDRPKAPHIFRLKANIAPSIVLRPPLIEVNPRDPLQVTKVRITSALKQAFQISKVRFNEKLLDVKYSKIADAWELSVRWKGEALTDPMTDSIEIETDGILKNLYIPVVGLH